MSETYYAMDVHTRICDAIHLKSKTKIQERYALAKSQMIYQKASEHGINLSHSIATGTDADGINESDKINDIIQYLDAYTKTEEGQREFATILLDIMSSEQWYLERAETIFVSTDIIEEVKIAASTMPDNVLIPQDVFVPNGMFIFEEPLQYTLNVQNGLFEETWDITALQFNTITTTDGDSGIQVRMYGSWRKTYAVKKDETISYNPETRKFELNNVEDEESFMFELAGINDGAWQEQLMARAITNTNLADATYYSFGSSTELLSSLNEVKKFIIALFRMTHSYLDIEHDKPPRHFVKRAKRSKRVIPDDYYLTVLTLRHKIPHNAGGTHSSPKFAFRVRGHWARRYLRSTGKPVGDPEAYRNVYISDYLKGSNKPFVESTRIIKIKN